jgi:hypothetical protein
MDMVSIATGTTPRTPSPETFSSWTSVGTQYSHKANQGCFAQDSLTEEQVSEFKEAFSLFVSLFIFWLIASGLL